MKVLEISVHRFDGELTVKDTQAKTSKTREYDFDRCRCTIVDFVDYAFEVALTNEVDEIHVMDSGHGKQAYQTLSLTKFPKLELYKKLHTKATELK